MPTLSKNAIEVTLNPFYTLFQILMSDKDTNLYKYFSKIYLEKSENYYVLVYQACKRRHVTFPLGKRRGMVNKDPKT